MNFFFFFRCKISSGNYFILVDGKSVRMWGKMVKSKFLFCLRIQVILKNVIRVEIYSRII